MREFRKSKPIFIGDFWNDGPLVGGCIAGGRSYLHINNNGDIEPCVFAHFAVDNIKEKSLKEALKSLLFKDIRSRQPYDDNLLRPCMIIDNPWVLRGVVKENNAHPTHPGAESILTDNVVEIVWGTTVLAHGGSDGFAVSTIEKMIRLKPTGAGLLIGSPQGMQPIDTKKAPKYDAKELNKYRIEWTTVKGGKYKFKIIVNDIELEDQDGDNPVFNKDTKIIEIRLELREVGEHTIDYVKWCLNGGKLPGLAVVDAKGKLTTTWGSVKTRY